MLITPQELLNREGGPANPGEPGGRGGGDCSIGLV